MQTEQVYDNPYNHRGKILKSYTVKELMVPLSEYATVRDDATLYQAVLALEKAQEDFDHTRYRHRAVLILDKKNNVIGKLSQLDALKALEPKYNGMFKGKGMQQFGLTKLFMTSMLKDHHLFERPMKDICQKAGRQNVKKFMYTPTEGEFVGVNETLDKAIHQLVLGHHQSLLVMEASEIIGVLRLTDVFAAVYHTMKACFVE
jgi:CBS domain-containing protein